MTEPGHADTIVETDVTEKHRRENTVDRICFQIIGRCQDHLGIRRKDTRQKISMGKSGIRGRYLNLTSYPAFASNECGIRFFEMIPEMQCNKSPSDEL